MAVRVVGTHLQTEIYYVYTRRTHHDMEKLGTRGILCSLRCDHPEQKNNNWQEVRRKTKSIRLVIGTIVGTVSGSITRGPNDKD